VESKKKERKKPIEVESRMMATRDWGRRLERHWSKETKFGLDRKNKLKRPSTQHAGCN
jgi:hypothetical protein